MCFLFSLESARLFARYLFIYKKLFQRDYGALFNLHCIINFIEEMLDFNKDILNKHIQMNYKRYRSDNKHHLMQHTATTRHRSLHHTSGGIRLILVLPGRA